MLSKDERDSMPRGSTRVGSNQLMTVTMPTVESTPSILQPENNLSQIRSSPLKRKEPPSSRIAKSAPSFKCVKTKQKRQAKSGKRRDSHFMDLPREIRQQILLYTVTDAIILKGIRLGVVKHENKERSVKLGLRLWVYPRQGCCRC
jgi:hypothetical protein